MWRLGLALLTRLTTGLSGHGGSRSDSGSGWSMLVVSALIKDLVKISVSFGQLIVTTTVSARYAGCQIGGRDIILRLVPALLTNVTAGSVTRLTACPPV